MSFTDEHAEDGVTERYFVLTVSGERVPGVVWTPAGAVGPRPLLLVGHGGGMHKAAPPILAGARRYVRTYGYAVAAIDAPVHGARVAPEDAARVATDERERVLRSPGMRAEALDVTLRRAAALVPEWKGALDFVQALEEIGRGGPVGYSGVSMGAFLGIPFVAEEPRITAAVFGLVGAEALLPAARRITVPLQFTVQWDDAFVAREDALALFTAFGSREKTLHANPGGHAEVPAAERACWEAFFVRQFGRPVTAPRG